VWFALLGPLTVAGETGEPVEIVGRRLRVLLAALLLEANTPVSGEVLAEAVWDAAPSPGAHRTLHSHIARLRRTLGAPGAERIEAREPGYLVRVAPTELDVLQFEARCRASGEALRCGSWEQAAEEAMRALGLWRGQPLMDVPSQVLRDRFVPRLEQLRLQALEGDAEAGMRLGRHEQLVLRLRELAGQHPLRERVHAQLITALAGCGRRAEALEAYRHARRALVEQLGVEPGAELRELHGRILAGEDVRPVEEPSADRTPASAPAVAAPRQLPAAPGHFTGRHTELELLVGLPDHSRPAAAGGTVVISAIDGMAGIGKTALAVHAAQRLSEHFPGGQLFIDLDGYTKGRPPREPGHALEAFLRALGVTAQQIPDDTEQRAALYRQRLVDTRTLVVLDNALDEAQVRPLLPSDPGCLVLVTSRRRLKGLDDARSLSVDLLPHADAVVLLRAVAGSDRFAADDPLLGEIAQLCGYLPLALRIAGALLRHRPAWSLRHLADLLHERRRGLKALSDGERDLSGAFDLSYAALDGRQRCLIRRLGLVPGPDADAYAAAALLDTDPDAATVLLEDLVDHNLLIEYVPSRYRLHDLIRAYARTLAGQDGEDENDAALGRVLDYYAHTAHSASALFAGLPRPGPDCPAPVHAPAISGSDAARAWLRTERDNLEAAIVHAHAVAMPERAVALTTGLAEILYADGTITRALELHQAAVDTAEGHRIPRAHATALTDLGFVRFLTGDLPGAEEALTRAWENYREIGDRLGEANALATLGVVRLSTGDVSGAEEALTRAREIYRETGQRNGEANAQVQLGSVRLLSGELSAAEEVLTRAREIYRETGQRNGEANALAEWGHVRQLAGDLSGAAEALSQALKIQRETGYRQGEADALLDLGVVLRLSGDLSGAAQAQAQAQEISRAIGSRASEATALAESGIIRLLVGDVSGAAEALAQALEVFRASGCRSNEAWALNHYAATVAASGQRPRALALYQQALAVNRELNKPADEAASLEGIAAHHLATGDPIQSAAHLHQALGIYERLGMTLDVERVYDQLTKATA